MTLREFTARWIAMFADPSLPAAPSDDEIRASNLIMPEKDGRTFAWVKVKDMGGLNPVYPAIIYPDAAGPQLEYVGGVHLLEPQDYHLTLTELAAKYPAPKQSEP